jgi:hypothetical protein
VLAQQLDGGLVDADASLFVVFRASAALPQLPFVQVRAMINDHGLTCKLI